MCSSEPRTGRVNVAALTRSVGILADPVLNDNQAENFLKYYIRIVGLVLSQDEALDVGRARGSEHILVDYVRESSVFTIWLSFDPWGTRVVSTAAAALIAPFASPVMSLVVLTYYDKRG